MDRESQERGRSLPTPKRQRIYLGINDDKFKKLRRETESIFRQSSESLNFFFLQYLNVKQTRSQGAKELQAFELQSASDQHQDLFYFEWKYRQALQSLKWKLAKRKIGAVLQYSYKQMLDCFNSYRQRLLKDQETSIEARKEQKLSSISKQRESQRTKLQEKLKKTQQEEKQIHQLYVQSCKKYSEAFQKKDPKQSTFEKYLDSMKDLHKSCKEKVEELKCDLNYKLDDEIERERQRTNNAFAEQWKERQRELLYLLDIQMFEHEMIKINIQRKVKEELNSLLEQLQQQVILLKHQLIKNQLGYENVVEGHTPNPFVEKLKNIWQEKNLKMLELRQNMKDIEDRLHQYE